MRATRKALSLASSARAWRRRDQAALSQTPIATNTSFGTDARLDFRGANPQAGVPESVWPTGHRVGETPLRSLRG